MSFEARGAAYPISPGFTINRGIAQGDWKGGVRNAVDPFGLTKSKPMGHEASDMLAALYRSEWEDYKNRFMPEEQRQVDAMSDRSNIQERQQAISDVGHAYERAPQQLEQSAFTSGVTLTPEDKAAYGRRLNTEQGLATVDAANRVTRKQTDRAYGIFSNPGYSPGGVGLNSMRGKVI